MVYGKRVDGLIFLYAQENDPLVQLVAEEQFPFLILGNHFLLSFRLLIMITSKPDLMRPNISSKKDAVALLSLVVPRSSSLPRTVSQVTSKHFKNTICLLIVTVPSLQTSF